MNSLEKESVQDHAESRKTPASKTFLLVLLVGIALMVAAFVGGFFATGSTDGNQRMGRVTPSDTETVTASDTTIGK